MTIATIKTIANRFLTNKNPEVLALKGTWGVGKTYTWDKILRENKDQIKLENYCYVSLFGITSLSELRTAIFTKMQPVKLLGEKLDSQTINKEWMALISKYFKRVQAKFRDVPYIKNISVGIEAIAPHFIRNTIICLDDFERLNVNRIQPDELLGFISELKEEKNCKVVLIFNEEKLEAIDIYKKYREKVVDIEILFAPTAFEATELVFPANLPNREAVKKYCVLLGIKNIRILRKIVELTEMIYKEVGTLHPSVMEQAVMTLVLLTWSYYDSSKNKPPLEFLKKWNHIAWAVNPQEEQDKTQTDWAKVLQNYGSWHMDEFGLAISKVIEHGYTEETGLLEKAVTLDAQVRADELAESFFVAWRLFHDSFSNNTDELVPALANSFKKSVIYISPANLNGTTKLLRELGRSDIADELIDFYIDARKNEEALFDLDNYPFSEEITDPVIREKFNQRHAELHKLPSLIETINYIATNSSWSKKHIQVLKKASVNDFFELFKLKHGRNLDKIVETCLRFNQYGDDMESIGQNSRAALVRIGKESPLNAIRVKKYGVTIDDADTNPNIDKELGAPEQH